MRKAVSAEGRFAMTLYYLATTAEFRPIAHLFSVSTSSMCICVKEVSEAINRNLSRVFPQGDDLVEVMNSFELLLVSSSEVSEGSEQDAILEMLAHAICLVFGDDQKE